MTAESAPVLVLDASPLQRLLLMRALRAEGLTSLPAGSLQEACEAVRRAGPVAAFVELLLDADNGFACGRRLIEDFDLPCVLLSASGQASDRDWALRCGFRALLERPLDTARLRAVLQDLGLREAGA